MRRRIKGWITRSSKITSSQLPSDRNRKASQHRQHFEGRPLVLLKGSVALLISRSSCVGLADCITHSRATITYGLDKLRLSADFRGGKMESVDAWEVKGW